MSKKIITFTLANATSGDYEKIFEKIKQIVKIYCKVDETTILVKTERSTVNLREILKEVALVGKMKTIFVTHWEHPSAWIGLSEEQTNWLKNN